jgi:FtsH-binding integral membrane protein
MSYNQFDNYDSLDSSQAISKSEVSTFMSKIFSYMFFALLLSGATAYVIGTSEHLLSYLLDSTGPRPTKTLLGWVVMLAPLGIVIYMATRIEKASVSALLTAFILFSIVFGASISYIFAFYELPHIYLTFFISAATFGIMAVVGYTTSTDLTKMGQILMMAVIGLIIASVANWFMQSSAMSYYISGAGVLIFTGLTAYDTQKLKRMGMQVGAHSEMAQKMIIMGALTLYLDFINLFLFMLRFMGGRD